MTEFIDPFKLPYVDLLDRKNLPNCPAIYFAIDSQNRVLYVGQATNLATRWKNHHRVYQLQEINKDSLVRIAWQPWTLEDLSEAERYFINNLHPLLNGTEVETPDIIASEFILRDFLNAFSRRLIITGIKPKSTNQLAHIYLKYDWTDCSPKGTAAKIKNFIQENKGKNTSIKFQWKKYGRIQNAEALRPGSRAQKVNARLNRSYNNHWEVPCNGVLIHIMPTDHYKEFKEKTDSKKLAGIKLRALTQTGLIEMSLKYIYDGLSGLFPYDSDIVPLLWVNSLSSQKKT
ncbi:hypothetical protein PA905_16170 [Planktothrix agardhii CCAP 1459/11A]|uniref:GIY-YIG domain-containing protein n=1 Tax=Planktothrix agardhii CCAP 1459/11A TaxID=282420 RepID=A0A4P5ZYM7_PLAAG|nr:GIY-YIG nuclease family protein [Planktothrix agardhii]GDZ93777.1 hypothetical protein PA905_16170 [Planktothrix agardhii CCAP 1459/11A]